MMRILYLISNCFDIAHIAFLLLQSDGDYYNGICVKKENYVFCHSWIKQLNGTSPSVFSSSFLFLAIFLFLLFSFHSLPSKMDKRQEECLDTPHRRLFIFRHCWISRSKPRETARALWFIILFFDALFLSCSSCLSVVFVIPATTGRYPSSSAFAHCKTAFFPFRMVFTEDLGNCSLAVRTTSASNTRPADEFVRWTFNENPGDPVNFPTILFLPISAFSPPLLPFIARFWRPRSSCDLLLCCLPYAYTCRQVYQW